MNVDQALSLLWQAARPAPYLREAVELVEDEIHRLRALLPDETILGNLVGSTPVDWPNGHIDGDA